MSFLSCGRVGRALSRQLQGVCSHAHVVFASCFVRMREFTPSGQLVSTGIIQDHGFHVGDAIFRKADKVSGEIVQMFSNNIILKGTDGCEYTLPVTELVSGEWKHEAKQQAPQEVKEPDAWRAAIEEGAMKAQVVQEIYAAVEKLPDVTKDLGVMQKPKGVIAKTEFAKHKCVLVPVTTKVELATDPDKAPAASPQCIFLDSRKTSEGHLESNLMCCPFIHSVGCIDGLGHGRKVV